MLGNRRQGHGVGPGQIGHTSIAPGKMGEDLPPRWISQSGKRPVQGSRRIFNHLVNYVAPEVSIRK